VIDATYINAALRELASGLGLSELALDQRGACAFAVDDGALRVEMQVVPQLGALDLRVWLDQIALSARRAQAMLAANFCWQGASGAAFALDPMSGVPVLLRRCFEHDLAHGGLRSAVEQLVRHARAWPKHLESIDRPAAEPQGGRSRIGGLSA
jgi:hypothetical protein